MSNSNSFYENTEEQAVVGRIGLRAADMCAQLQEVCDTLQDRLEVLLEDDGERADEEHLLDILFDQMDALENVHRALMDTI